MPEIPSDNEKYQEELYRLISSGDALLMVGAGSSKIVGYPTWDELITFLEEAIRDIDNDNEFVFSDGKEDRLNYLVRVKTKLGIRYQSEIHRIFDIDAPERQKFHPCHVKLLELPFKAVLTTNYDKVLEAALFEIKKEYIGELNITQGTSSREINRFFESLNFGSNSAKPIAHIHGLYTQYESIVLCAQDYEKLYGTKESVGWTLHKRIMWALMATRRIVYVGFSMNDPFFQMMHEIVSDDFGRFHSQTHYLLSRFPINLENTDAEVMFAKKLKSDLGIQTVFFPDDENYDGLNQYLFHLNGIVRDVETEEAIPKVLPKEKIKVTEVLLPENFLEEFKNKALSVNKKIREDEN